MKKLLLAGALGICIQLLTAPYTFANFSFSLDSSDPSYFNYNPYAFNGIFTSEEWTAKIIGNDPNLGRIILRSDGKIYSTSMYTNGIVGSTYNEIKMPEWKKVKNVFPVGIPGETGFIIQTEDNTNYALGMYFPYIDDSFPRDGLILEPRQIEKLNGITISKIVPLEEMMLIITEEGDVYTYGGSLGVWAEQYIWLSAVTNDPSLMLPKKVYDHTSLWKIISLDVGSIEWLSHARALTENGDILGAGTLYVLTEYQKNSTISDEEKKQLIEKYSSFQSITDIKASADTIVGSEGFFAYKTGSSQVTYLTASGVVQQDLPSPIKQPLVYTLPYGKAVQFIGEDNHLYAFDTSAWGNFILNPTMSGTTIHKAENNIVLDDQGKLYLSDGINITETNFPEKIVDFRGMYSFNMYRGLQGFVYALGESGKLYTDGNDGTFTQSFGESRWWNPVAWPLTIYDGNDGKINKIFPIDKNGVIFQTDSGKWYYAGSNSLDPYAVDPNGTTQIAKEIQLITKSQDFIITGVSNPMVYVASIYILYSDGTIEAYGANGWVGGLLGIGIWATPGDWSIQFATGSKSTLYTDYPEISGIINEYVGDIRTQKSYPDGNYPATVHPLDITPTTSVIDDPTTITKTYCEKETISTGALQFRTGIAMANQEVPNRVSNPVLIDHGSYTQTGTLVCEPSFQWSVKTLGNPVYACDSGYEVSPYSDGCIKIEWPDELSPFMSRVLWNEAPFYIGNTRTTLDSGLNHSCILKPDNTLWCVGDLYGEGKLGDQAFHQIPMPEGKMKDVQTGLYATIVLYEDGRVYSFGRNDHGILGQEYPEGNLISEIRQPTQIKALDWVKIQRIIMNQNPGSNQMSKVFAISDTGEVYFWGYNGKVISEKLHYFTMKNGDKYVIDISPITYTYPYSGSPKVIYSEKNGEIHYNDSITKSINTNDIIGSPELASHWYNDGMTQVGAPVKLVTLTGKYIVDINTANQQNFAIDRYGKIYAWGYNNDGFVSYLGIGLSGEYTYPKWINVDYPRLMGQGVKISPIDGTIVPGFFKTPNTCIENGLTSWADGTFALGNGYNYYDEQYGKWGTFKTPQTVFNLSTTKIKKVISSHEKDDSLNMAASYAIDENGKLWGWGINYSTYKDLINTSYAQQNNNILRNTQYPVVYTGSELANEKIQDLTFAYLGPNSSSAGWKATNLIILLTESGKVFQTTDPGKTIDISNTYDGKFYEVTALSDKKIIKIYASQYGQVYALSSDGSIYAWGNNFNLGVADSSLSLTTPQLVQYVDAEGKIANMTLSMASSCDATTIVKDGKQYSLPQGEFGTSLQASATEEVTNGTKTYTRDFVCNPNGRWSTLEEKNWQDPHLNSCEYIKPNIQVHLECSEWYTANSTSNACVKKPNTFTANSIDLGEINNFEGKNFSIFESILTKNTFNGTPFKTSDAVNIHFDDNSLAFIGHSESDLLIRPTEEVGDRFIKYTLCDKESPDNCQTGVISFHLIPKSDTGSGTSSPVPTVTLNTPDIELGDVNNFEGKSFNTYTDIISRLTINTLTPTPNTPVAIQFSPGDIPFVSNEGTISIGVSSKVGKQQIQYTVCDTKNTNICSSGNILFNYKEKSAVEATPVPLSSYTWGGSGGGGGGSSSNDNPIKVITEAISKLPAITITPKIQEETQKNSSPLSSASVVEEIIGMEKPLFVWHPLWQQCVSAIKNLDDPRLQEYANEIHILDYSDIDRSLTRVEFLKLLLNAANISLTPEDANDFENFKTYFSDVDVSAWYMPYIYYAYKHQIISGQELNGTHIFRPNDRLSRSEAAKILTNATVMKGSNLTVSEGNFIDIPADFSLRKYIEYAFDSCLLHGTNTRDGEVLAGEEGRKFSPIKNISIGETTKILYNLTHK